MIAFVGMVGLHLVGALLRALAFREPLRLALRSPSSWAFALAALGAFSLGLLGLLPAAALLLLARRSSAPAARPRLPWLGLAAISAMVLARPWVPTLWDEFVWLAKARLESLGFGAGVRLALDPSQHLLPPGYPPLWPAAVGWLSLGTDELGAQVLAGSLLALAALATAGEAWWPQLEAAPRGRALGVVVALCAPFVWIHARSVYLDLPLGLLGLSVLGFLLSGRVGPACAVAMVAAGFKDEGLAHVAAATLGALALRRAEVLRLGRPLVVAVVVVVTWRWLLRRHHVEVVDHALDAPAWAWAGTLLRLLVRHASDALTWGVFWGVALAVALARPSAPAASALRVTLAAGLGFVALAVLAGPERVRVFAESGTLLNRLLLQWWPTAALLVWMELSRAEPRARGTAAA